MGSFDESEVTRTSKILFRQLSGYGSKLESDLESPNRMLAGKKFLEDNFPMKVLHDLKDIDFQFFHQNLPLHPDDMGPAFDFFNTIRKDVQFFT